ncbi:MAG: chromophore lyase CpcT/CpeT [Bacteroidota bacterium]|nr:chromophore lyase CpcT/CpeT [Candidatus Kapabacteria bacterium]MDW8219225.1 chromophore lyase CpcT/CpeT [Bacteroidota bacterium]
MMHYSFAGVVGIACALLILYANSIDAMLYAQTPLHEDLKTMMVMITGEFDNFQQVWKEREDKIPDVHEHIHSIFFPVKLPAFGEHVLYVKQYMNGNPRNVYRQRLYVFSVNQQEQAIQLDIYSFPVDSLYYDAHLHPEKLTRLTPAMMKRTPGCEVYWKKTPSGDAFIGYMKDKTCSVISQRSGKRIFITDSLRLTHDELWIRDEAYDESGNYVFGHKSKIHHKLKRCRFFRAWMAVRIKEPKEGEKEQYVVMRNVTLHDQGQRIQCIGELDGKPYPTKYWAELAQVIYQTGLPVMKFAIYEEGNPKAIAYTWTNPEAKQIGINMRFVQGSATLKEGALFDIPDKP